MASFKYVSCIKIKGQPILPPLIRLHDRECLLKYKNEAIKKEEDIAERRVVSMSMTDFQSDSDSYDGSSSLRTEQVMEFIRQALSDDKLKNLEEVKMLQTAIFQELKKYASGEADESSDTLHDLEDLSPHDDKTSPFCDLSPIKTEPLDVPSKQLNVEFRQINSETLNVTPSKLIRRNSYTLESPSPSVLEYLKSLNKSDDSHVENSQCSISLGDKKVIRNLSKQWDDSLVDMKTPSPSNLITPSPFEQHISPNEKLIYNSDEKCSIFQDRLKDNKIDKILENNNITPQMEKAAAKIQAGFRGYVIRRLMKTFKVIELKNIIKDSLITALQLHSEINMNRAEVDLHKRLALQVESACREWHSIFFQLSPQEQMKIIQVDRNRALLPKKGKLNARYQARKIMSQSLSTLFTNNSNSRSPIARPSSLQLSKSSISDKPWR